MAKTIEVTRTVDNKESKYTFEQAKLKSRDKSQPPNFAFVPRKPVTDEDYDKVQEFLGKKDLINLAMRVWRQFSVNWSESAGTKTNGAPVDSDIWKTTFTQLAAAMSAEGLSMKALRAEDNELKQELYAIIANTSMTPVEKNEKITAIGTRMKEIQDSLTARAAKKDDEESEVDTESSGEEAKEVSPTGVMA
jgi:hypothetical protein